MTAEEWRPIPGFPGYFVSDHGRVLTAKLRPRILRALLYRGYPRVRLVDAGGRNVTRTVHTLVAEAFHGPRPAQMEVRHLDGDKLNNTPANLRYGTRSENQRDAVRHRTHAQSAKTHCLRGHLFDEKNTRLVGRRRICRTCSRLHKLASIERRTVGAAA